MSGRERIAVVTGASSGIGELLACALARDKWRIAVVNRSAQRSRRLLDVFNHMDASATVIEADLADQDQLRAAADRILNSYPHIDALFNNAGVMLPRIEVSPQGNELHAEVNWLAPYQMMQHLRPHLSKARGTVVNTSSQALRFAGKPDAQSMLHPPKANGMGLFGAYARSKLALTTTTRALANEYRAEGIRLLSIHPGVLSTKMTKGQGMPWWLRVLGPITYEAPEKGAARLYEALSSRFEHASGGFIVKGQLVKLPAYARDPARHRELLAAAALATEI